MVKAIISKEYQHLELQAIDREYEKDLARIKETQASTPPPVA
jgi:hypothetical protein